MENKEEESNLNCDKNDITTLMEQKTADRIDRLFHPIKQNLKRLSPEELAQQRRIRGQRGIHRQRQMRQQLVRSQQREAAVASPRGDIENFVLRREDARMNMALEAQAAEQEQFLLGQLCDDEVIKLAESQYEDQALDFCQVEEENWLHWEIAQRELEEQLELEAALANLTITSIQS